MREEKGDWQSFLNHGFSAVGDLLRFLELPVALGSQQAEQQFKTRVPLGFAQRMEKGNPKDPLLLQVLASVDELMDVDAYIDDPLQESSSRVCSGLIHKYHGRVLLVVTGSCAVHCRYCFRRHFPYEMNNPGRKGWQDAFDYIKKNVDIKEVILSGGDPLMASTSLLAFFIEQLSLINHVTTLRIHTRIPVVLPERIDEAFLELMQTTHLNKVMVLHANHANELSADVLTACNALKAKGVVLLNQSVLLRDVNDSLAVLTDLSWRLLACGIVPYYLHVLDKVKGAAHFDLSIAKARGLFLEMQSVLPGYLVPRFVCEIPSAKNKTIITETIEF